MSYNFGYKQGAKMSADMGLNSPTRVTVKPHTRAPRVAKPSPLPLAPVSPAKGMPKLAEVKGYAKGGKVCAPGMAKGGKWIAGATKNKGALHRALGVPSGEKIPAKKLAAGAKSKSPMVRKEVSLAKTLKSFKK